MRPLWIPLAALLVVAACSDDKKIEQPAHLTPLATTLAVKHVWGASVNDKGGLPLRLGLGISLANNRIYAAGHGGEVVALDVNSGHVVWRTRAGAPFSGGTAASTELVLVGSTDGQFFAFDAANGKNRWKVRLNGEVLSAAAVSARLIAVRTGDGKLHGLSPVDGHALWTQEQQVPRLSLRGTASPVIVGDVVLSGFDNGKVVAVNSGDGSLLWEATVTPPHGRTELERLSDIDSVVGVSGQDVYAVGFQGRVAMLALDTGQVWWSHEASSYHGLAVDGDMVYVASTDGEVVALRGRSGAEIWRQSALMYRALSPLALMDEAVVAGDFQGYLHFIDKATGALIGRAQAGHVRISTAPVVAGNLVVVMNDKGQISAFRVTPLPAAEAAKAKKKYEEAERAMAKKKPKPPPKPAPAPAPPQSQ